MALRVDDIVVTEKNILLLSGGHQFIADIEKNTDSLDNGNFTRDRNPWNFYSSEGVLYHNLFDTDSFDVRTQTLTGSTRHSPNNSRSHEPIFMPHDSGYVGGCQFYGNAYTITNFTNSTVSSYVESGFDNSFSTYCSDHGTIRYNALSSYENPSEYYISPNILFEPTDGVQFITEYPLNGYYMDFGDNETDGNPTVFGDSVLAKYYLDQNYSVSSYDIDSIKSRFRQLRSYYDIGSTGNAIYMVFRNNLNGTAEIVDDGQTNESNEGQLTDFGYFPVDRIGYMSNLVTMSTVASGTYYSSDPYSDMFKYETMSNISSGLVAIKQPEDHSFILYLQQMNPHSVDIKLTYIPTIGLERSSYTLQISEYPDNLSIVELPHCVVIGTNENGILTIWSRDYLYDGGDTLVNFNPFQYACSGVPSFETLTSKIDGNIYQNVKLFYNGKDILGATAVVNNELRRRVAFFSSNFDTDEQHYEIGQFFMPAGNPLYEIEVLSSETPVYQEALSSVPFSSWNDSTKEVSWNYKLQNVQVITDTVMTTSDPFQVSSNYVSECDVLFDYSSTEVEDELSIGSYAFVQFEKYGLSKCYVDDIYSNGKMVKFSSTGPINRYDSRPEIWRKLDNTTDAESHIKEKVISYSDLKTIPSPSNGDIYSIIDEHDVDGVLYDRYTYFRYTIDGNTSSWVETSLDYMNGYVDTYANLCEIDGVNVGDTYLLQTAYTTTSVPATAYTFFQYGVVGNLSSWNYVQNDSGLIRGRVNNYSNLPGHASGTATEGDVYFVKNAYTEPVCSIDACSYYIYDKYGADSGNDSIVRRWENIVLKTVSNWTELNNGDYLLSSIGTNGLFKGVVSYSEMMTNDTFKHNGHFVILKEDGDYNGIAFSKGESYKYDSTSTISNGWVYNTDNIKIYRKNGSTLDTPSYRYIGGYTSFDQLTHITPPERGSIYLIVDRYYKNSSTIPANSFYRYAYNDNQLDWWQYNIEEKVNGVVDIYSDLKDIRSVSHGDFYLVKTVAAINSKTYAANSFCTFGIDRNTSFWSNSSTFGDIKGTRVNYAGGTNNLFNISVASLRDGYVYGIQNEEHVAKADGYHTDNYAFYKFALSGTNASDWVPVNLVTEYNLPLSGHKDSYTQIENLSGDPGSLYYTESDTEPLVFYRLETNDSVKFCTDATFSVISYSDDTKKPILDVIDFVSSDYSTFFVSGKSAMKSTFKSGDGKITNSFSDFPLMEREIIKEPVFSSIKSISAETSPITGFNFAMGYPIEDSMGISVKTFSTESANHDASIALVKWNISSGEYTPQQDLETLDGLHLQYNAICTDVYMNGTILSSVDEETGVEMPQYSSTIYEYPHPCYGELMTAGTGLPIFDGPFSSDMTTSDMFFVNGYFVVKNYSVEVSAGHTDDWWETNFGKNVIESGKHQQFSTGLYPSGGYVVTNFFADGGDNGSSIPYLYDSELVFSSKEETKTKVDSERFYDYNYLWHIKPVKPIEFYPASIEGKTWTPYYPSKYVDFIKYHNGYYYISLRSKKDHDVDTVGYDIIETDTLFEERECVKLENGLIVSGIKFFDSHVAVEYERLNGDRFVKWFDSGKSFYKVLPVLYRSDISSADTPIKHAELSTKVDYSSEVVASYDNVEVMNSLNRFTPVVNHKSNLFSIRIDDLGFEESEYLTDYQKKVLRAYFRNSITELVDSVKPAHTQLFDVYLD